MYICDMSIYEKSNFQIAAETGERFKSYRLALRMTQKELSVQSGVSIMTIVRFERGECGSIKLDNLIALMRAIQRLDDIYSIIPEIPESLYSKKTFKQQQRVRRKKDER